MISQKSPLRWLTSFFALSLLFYWMDSTAWFQSLLVRTYSVFLAWLSASLLNLLGMHARQSGPILSTATAAFEFAGSCTASFVFLMYAAAVLSFPVPWRARVKGIGLGAAGIFMLNLLRGMMIVFVATRFRSALWSLHVIVGQILVIAGVVTIFIGWVRQTERGAPLIRLPLGKPSFRLAFLFATAYLLGSLFYYQLFIQSAVASWFRELIIRHSAAVLSLFMPASSSGGVLLTPARSLSLMPACLNSPVLVIAIAIVAAWPFLWWKKIVLIAAGFLPLFYLFNLVRVCSIVLTLPLNSAGEHSFVHTYFGGLTLIGLLLYLGGYELCVRRQIMGAGHYAAYAIVALLAAIVLAGFSNYLYRQILLPWELQLIQNNRGLKYDPEQTLSRMAGVQTFIWILAALLAPIFKIGKKAIAVLMGSIGFLIFSSAFVALVAGFQLTPHIRLIKVLTLALPIIAALPMWLKSQSVRFTSCPER